MMDEKLMSDIFNLKAFHESTTKELDVVKNRVRNLIGDSNWGVEGQHKEAVLREVIKRFMPKKYGVGTGFVVKNQNGEYMCSSQIDILIFDFSYPLLFSEGDFIIVTPDSVKAVIEVKSNIENAKITDVIKKMDAVGKFISESSLNRSIFNGIFSFDGYNEDSSLQTRLNGKVSVGRGYDNVNHISLNKDIFMKFWPDTFTPEGTKPRRFSVYHLKNLSFSYFISNLITYVTDKPIDNESDIWFPENKEDKKLFDISCGWVSDATRNKRSTEERFI